MRVVLTGGLKRSTVGVRSYQGRGKTVDLEGNINLRCNVKRGVCIVECLDEGDPGSEGRVLREIFNLMEVESKLIRVASIDRLLHALSDNEFQHVHITTHGTVTDDKKFKGWWTPNGVGSKRMVNKHQVVLSCTSLVSTACLSGSKGFAKHVTGVWGSKYYIAPTGSPRFHNAALFSHIYYHKLFGSKGTVFKAFSSYMKSYTNPHNFTLFERDDR